MSSAIVHFGADESCIVGALAENGYRVRDCDESLVSLAHQIMHREFDAVVVSDHTVCPTEAINDAAVRGTVPVILFEGHTPCECSAFDLVVPRASPSDTWLQQVQDLIQSARNVRAEANAAVERTALLRQEFEASREKVASLREEFDRQSSRVVLRPREMVSEAVNLRCVLVADDHPQWRHTAMTMLERHVNARIAVEASNGATAVRRAEQLKPDLVLMDVNMPGMNGIEATRRIREALPDTPVIVVSMTNLPTITREALNAGANGYILKIEAASELWPAVQAALEKKQYISKNVRAS